MPHPFSRGVNSRKSAKARDQSQNTIEHPGTEVEDSTLSEDGADDDECFVGRCGLIVWQCDCRTKNIIES